eukprot:TRINITY_DN6962_c0_g1_i1.p1 TRINITY_DN6962_c0_g1~~TRINITY_DN6962_c0_g1_i1.p1  ORF type:complete len:741 (-),score=155.70 TRINITY_DN6962_c0_g1_i1:8-2230(-)
MALKLTAPEHYVVPLERFDRQHGINVAEFEFPAYFNFFIKRQQINLITTKRGEQVIRKVLQETLFGPEDINIKEDDCPPNLPDEQIPDIARELAMFRKNPFKQMQRMEIDDLVRFTIFDNNGVANVTEDVSVRVCFDEPVFMDDLASSTTQATVTHNGPVVQSTDTYVVIEKGEEIARIPMKVDLRLPDFVDSNDVFGAVFSPPLFGVTMLGSSHGFDPDGSTTGMVVWVNHSGIMVDPPPNSGTLLARSGIPAASINAIILTHCHADHDAGTFQKILAERKVTLITTKTIMKSFVRKYSAVTGLDEELLRQLFKFKPALLGQKLLHNGAELRFYYSLHSIPCIRFEVYFGGKSMVFSGDTFNHPERLQELHESGEMSKFRYEELSNFPWHHDLILHEAGVPPIHTPMSTFEPLPDDVKERLYLVHVAKKDVPVGVGLKAAKDGVDETLVIDADDCPDSAAIRVLSLISNVDFLSSLRSDGVMYLLQTARTRKFSAGDVIVQEGDAGDSMFIIGMGVCGVLFHGERKKTLVTGDYFGEIGVVTQMKRTVSIQAASPCVLYEWDCEALRASLPPDILAELAEIAKLRQSKSWKIVEQNTMLSGLSSAQKMEFQGLFEDKEEIRAGDTLWKLGSPADMAVILASGELALREVPHLVKASSQQGQWTLGKKKVADYRHIEHLQAGALIGDFTALRKPEGRVNSFSLTCVADATYYPIRKGKLLPFLERNPGVSLILVDALECT